MSEQREKYLMIRFSGVLLMASGVLTFLINLIFLPVLDSIEVTSDKIISSFYLWRQSLSLLVALLLLVSVLGLFCFFSKQKHSKVIFLGLVGILVGNSLLIAQEWNQVFFVRPMIIASPEAMAQLDSATEINLLDIGSIIIFSTFVLSWIFFSIIVWKQQMINKQISLLIIIGFFMTPILSVLLPYDLGAIVGNGILGLGWFLLGRTLYLSK